jgi:hypothetical protein
MARTDWNVNEIIQRVSAAIPALSIGSNEVTVTWPIPFIDTNYTVQTTPEAVAATIGGMVPGCKSGASKTTTGCTIVMYNTLLVSIGAGGTVQVTATGNI